MQEYWDGRFRQEGRVWGEAASRTAVYARDLFRLRDVKNVLVPGAGHGRNAEYLAAAALTWRASRSRKKP
ncbi:MAG: hypothetical protein AB1445_08550 [Bacillota bacterium]